MNLFKFVPIKFSDETLTVSLNMECCDPHHRQSSMSCCKKELIAEFSYTPGSAQSVVIKRGNVDVLEVESIHFDVYCPSLYAMYNLYHKYVNGAIETHFCTVLNIDNLRKQHDIPGLYLNVEIKDVNNDVCRLEIQKAFSE